MKCPVFRGFEEGYCLRNACKYYQEDDLEYCHYKEWRDKQRDERNKEISEMTREKSQIIGS